MREYRLFIVKKEIFSIYKKKPALLFETLQILFSLRDNLTLGASLYQQICSPFAVSLLCNYISEKIPTTKVKPQTYRLLSFYENTMVQIRSSHILLLTDQENSALFRTFNIYHRYIFVVDFKNNIYFWLNEYISKHFL